MPTGPAAPASFEFSWNALAAANTNPFTGQQQVQDWQAHFMEVSVSLPPMYQSGAQAWLTFLEALDGVANVFQFSTALCTAYPAELTSDGSTPRYWCLKSNRQQWAVKRGSIYSITFEIREAI